jgi:formate dehydrogenase iron-sulfur subunit
MTAMTKIPHHAFLFDATRCIDCRACMVACSVENNIAHDKTRIWVAGRGVIGVFPALKHASMVYHCMHCLVPDCLSACPVGAYTKRPDGPVIYNPAVCIGCRYCMNACAFGVPHFDYDKGIIDGAFIDKCTFCPQRIDVGLEPACVATCPTDALEYGDRDELIKIAHERIKAHPGRYLEQVYGEFEKGGTSYLIVSNVPFTDLGLPEMGPEPINKITEDLMRGTIPFSLGWAGVLTAAALGVRLVKHTQQPAVSDPQNAEKEESAS